MYVDDLVFATAETEAHTLVNSELKKRHTCTDLGELRSYLGLHITRDRARHTIILTQSHMGHQVLQRFGFQFSSQQPTPLSAGHSLSAPPSDESVEPSGPYPKLVGCLITSGMGLVLGGRGPVVLTSHADASWQRGQLRLAYMAIRANTAYIFNKALPPGDHQRFSTVLGLLALLFLTGLRWAFGGSVSCTYVIRTGDRSGQTCGKPHTQHRCFSRLDDAWRAEVGAEAERLARQSCL
ncbi:unnamed protein product, partial [Closterium sp. NIES-53]